MMTCGRDTAATRRATEWTSVMHPTGKLKTIICKTATPNRLNRNIPPYMQSVMYIMKCMCIFHRHALAPNERGLHSVVIGHAMHRRVSDRYVWVPRLGQCSEVVVEWSRPGGRMCAGYKIYRCNAHAMQPDRMVSRWL
jgi:hypothetical protein